MLAPAPHAGLGADGFSSKMERERQRDEGEEDEAQERRRGRGQEAAAEVDTPLRVQLRPRHAVLRPVWIGAGVAETVGGAAPGAGQEAADP